jgi:prolyl oligopeptidase
MRPALLSLAALLAMPMTASAADDPHLWLEAVEDEKALAWVREQNVDSVDELTRSGDFKRIQSRVREILDSDARIPFVGKMGEHYYNFWRDAKNPRGLWRRTSLDEYRKAEPAWEVVLDLDELAKAEGENWVWAGSNCLEPEYRKCLLDLSRGGADATVTREFDTVEKRFVEGGFALPEAKSSVSWIDADTLFVGTDFGQGSMTDSGYPRIAKRWQRGTPLEQAETVYEGQSSDVWIAALAETTPGFERQVVYRGITFYTNEVHLIRDGQLVRLDKQDSANFNLHRQWLLLELREDWTVGGKTWPAGALLVTKLEDFLAGGRDFEMLFTPSERTSLAGYTRTLNHIVVNELDNVRNKLYVWTHDGSAWKREALAGLPEFGTVSLSAIDSNASDDYWATVNDFLTPTSLYWGQLEKGPPTVIKSMPAFFDAAGMTVSQNEATSKDGTKVPYFLVSKEAIKLDGKNPTVLYGYGGFEVSMTPSYVASIGESWLEKGGVYVVANIRGGGEFGPKWHQAALKANRNKAYEDFIAVAEDLIARKITATPHLGILGGSNGGLLMGNMLTMRPDLFGAIVCQVPLLDMQRYHTLLAGASWMGEYGNPDEPAEWAWLQQYSPYHNVKAEVSYPRTLFTTSTRDDRVHPGHARKMVARMKEQGHDVLYYENIEGGHGGAANNEQRAFMTALAWTFFARELR